MASPRTIEQVLAEISCLYPNQFPLTKESSAVWARYLRDMDDELLVNALHHYAATSPDNYPPSVPALRKSGSELKRLAAGIPSAAEAWGAVMDSFHFTSSNQPKLIQHPLVKETLRCMGGLEVIGRSENNMADRAHFIKLYESIAEKSFRQEQELPEVTKYIEKLGRQLLPVEGQERKKLGEQDKESGKR
jgi:hypothetical protein